MQCSEQCNAVLFMKHTLLSNGRCVALTCGKAKRSPYEFPLELYYISNPDFNSSVCASSVQCCPATCARAKIQAFGRKLIFMKTIALHFGAHCNILCTALHLRFYLRKPFIKATALYCTAHCIVMCIALQ